MIHWKDFVRSLPPPRLSEASLKSALAFQLYILWFNFILGLSFISLCYKLIIIHHHTPKQREIKTKDEIELLLY